jgi:hypothetical protein
MKISGVAATRSKITGGGMDWDLRSARFISEPVEVYFEQAPVFEKIPDCPSGFVWRGSSFRIIKTLAEWRDYRRRGRMARNMRPTHAVTADRRGSWGVGLFYFRVLTDKNRIFDLYYDRAPKDADHRKGSWFLFQELTPDPEIPPEPG